MSDRRVAVITGGAGTIGAACARHLAEHRLLLVDSSEEHLEEVAAQLRQDGAEVSFHAGDVRDPATADAVAATASELGPLAALVSTAGLSGAQADGRTILEVNLVGTLLMLDAFEPQANPGAVAVPIGSVSGHRRFARQFDPVLADAGADDVLARLEEAGALGLHARAAYAISKRGVILQTQIRAAAWGRRGGRIVSVSPGLIGGTTHGGLVGESKAYATRSALDRTGTVDEIGAAVAFLCSPQAAYITGTDLLVDGGTRAGTDWHETVEARLRWNGPPVVD
jgi:NAD(P)-dependent dehydrogenase (short-subunit alcohol dehydrogenase family)